MGRADARAHRGLPESAYVVYSTSDALAAPPHAGAIDAIIVGTPFERVRFASFEAAFDGRAATASDLDAAATPNTVDVIVFAHSRDPLDQKFLHRFEKPALEVLGRSRRITSTTLVGPTQDFFNTPAGRQLLWLGSVDYRFDLHGVDPASHARFRVSDPYGKAYDVPIALAKYR